MSWIVSRVASSIVCCARSPGAGSPLWRWWLAAVVGIPAAVAAAAPVAAGSSDIGVVVANAVYQESGIAEVKYAKNDGDAVAAAMAQVFGMASGNILRRDNQTKSNLNSLFGREHQPEGLVWRMVERAGNDKARLIVYYSGHGVPPLDTRDRTRSEAGLLSQDASFDDIKEGVYALQTLRDNLKALKLRLLPNGEVVLILESCFSGQRGDNKPLRAGISASVFAVTRTAPPAEIIEIDAAQDNQAAFWDDASRHGTFTHQLLWGLYGKADDGGGKVTLRTLAAYVTRGLEHKGDRQTASFSRADDTVLSTGPWPRRRDMIEIETTERAVCEKMRYEANYSTREQHIEALRSYPGTCAWCGCETEAGRLLNELEEKQETCHGVRTALGASTDAGLLLGLIKDNQCPDLQGDLLNRTWGLLKDKGSAEQLRRLGTFLPAGSALKAEVEARTAMLEHRIPPPGDPCSGAVTVSSATQCHAPLTPAQERTLKPRDSFRECADCPEMTVVPGGTFTMGSPASEQGRFDNEGPQHVVTIRRQFAVGRHHVTRDQFAAFVKDSGYAASTTCYRESSGFSDGSWRDPGFAQDGSHPVVCVSFDDAKAYAAWVSTKTGRTYRLLSEAEWEYAARVETSPGSYPRFWFGNDEQDLCRNGNGVDQAARAGIKAAKGWTIVPCNDGYAYTSPVGHYAPNGFGLYDMAGNAWQWTEDCEHDNYQGAPADGSAWTTGNCDRHVTRGGSWDSYWGFLRSASRSRGTVANYSHIGFRLARTLVTP